MNGKVCIACGGELTGHQRIYCNHDCASKYFYHTVWKPTGMSNIVKISVALTNRIMQLDNELRRLEKKKLMLTNRKELYLLKAKELQKIRKKVKEKEDG